MTNFLCVALSVPVSRYDKPGGNLGVDKGRILVSVVDYSYAKVSKIILKNIHNGVSQ